VRIAEKGMKEWKYLHEERRYCMPEVRLDIEGVILDGKVLEVPAVKESQGRFKLVSLGISHTCLGCFLNVQESIDKKIAHQHVEVFWYLKMIRNGGAGILRALTTFEVHLSPSFSLVNPRALSVAMTIRCNEEVLLCMGSGGCYGR
jgi:hypothetical protein